MLLLAFGCSSAQHELNVVLLTVDTLRADHLGCYGYSQDTSPHIDRLAAESLLFENAFAQGGWTKPSMATLFTSLVPRAHGALSHIGDALPLEAYTLAERLHDASYRTMAFQTNSLINHKQNFDQGFDHFHSQMDNAGAVIDLFLAELDRGEPGKFFAYLHFMDTHLPYHPPNEHRRRFEVGYRGRLEPEAIPMYLARMAPKHELDKLGTGDRRHIVALYDASIHYVDEQIGRLLAALAERELLDRTIVILLSDHGEEFFEHGNYFHGHSLYNEVLRVPLIIRHPHFETGARIESLVRLIDLFPTLMPWLGLSTPTFLMGEDLAPLLRKPPAPLELASVAEGMYFEPQQISVQTSRYKLIQNLQTSQIEFYDLQEDPRERTALTQHAMLPAYLERLREHRAASYSLPHLRVEPDAETLEELRQLGYID